MEESTPEDMNQMPNEGDDSEIERYLSPSARAMLRVLKDIEDGRDVHLFQEDPYIERLRMMSATTRGSLYSAAVSRISDAVSLGGVSVVTQQDVMSLLELIWKSSISRLSRTEIVCLRSLLQSPDVKLNEMAEREGMSYSRLRRGYLRLRQSGVLKTESMLHCDQLGLERMLVILQNPSLVLESEYIENTIFIDGPAPMALLVVTYAIEGKTDVTEYIKSLRSTAENVTMWRLSEGKPRFSSFYFRYDTSSWTPDILHFRLVLRRGGEQVVMGDEVSPSAAMPELKASELRVMDALRADYEATAADIAKSVHLSASAVFRIRQSLQQKQVILPRARVEVPVLSEVALVTLPEDRIGDILPAWSLLPLTYVSRLVNLEDENDRRVLLISALPAGSGSAVLDVLRSESSRADDLFAHVCSAGITRRMSMESLFDRRNRNFRWEKGDFFNVRSYGIVRREAEGKSIPLDLT